MDTPPVYKLTAVTLTSNGVKRTVFVKLLHTDKGAVLPQATLDKLLRDMRVERGQTYTVG